VAGAERIARFVPVEQYVGKILDHIERVGTRREVGDLGPITRRIVVRLTVQRQYVAACAQRDRLVAARHADGDLVVALAGVALLRSVAVLIALRWSTPKGLRTD
jgi:hypothetical protein